MNPMEKYLGMTECKKCGKGIHYGERVHNCNGGEQQ